MCFVSNKGWREHNLACAVDTVADIIECMTREGESPRTIAEELAKCRFFDQHKASRMWLYKKDSWSGPLVMRGGDEYLNSTLVFRLPGGRALVVALNVPLKRRYCSGGHH
jgi:hypothetical protein